MCPASRASDGRRTKSWSEDGTKGSGKDCLCRGCRDAEEGGEGLEGHKTGPSLREPDGVHGRKIKGTDRTNLRTRKHSRVHKL